MKKFTKRVLNWFFGTIVPLVKDGLWIMLKCDRKEKNFWEIFF
ncbi:MAG: hypothetical protein NTX85_03825 [Candidatus Nomurabacteria bacterium]|nr:hypothetical protein [Candidatus Nomurabacteria bacterium]